MEEQTTQVRRFWQSLEERTSPPVETWNTPEFQKSRNQMRADAKKTKVSRKDFLKVMGAGAVMAGAACRRPTEQIVPAVTQPTEYTPGVSVYYSTTSPDGTGLIIRTREGRPVKIAGNPDHPLTQGGVAAYEVASLMDLYDPDRARKSSRIVKGKKKRATEVEIVKEAKEALGKGKYVLLTGAIDSPTTRKLIQEFLQTNPGGKWVELRPDPTLRIVSQGQAQSYGKAIVPYYRFDLAEVIVSIDADFIGTWIAPQIFAPAFAKGRELKNGSKNMNRLIAFESMFSLTGSNADSRHPILPGTEAAIALSLAAHISIKLKQGKYAGNATVTRMLENYLPAKLAASMKVDAGAIESAASALWNARGKSLVVAGSPLSANGKLASAAIAANLLNDLLENDGKTIDHANPLQLSPGASDREIQGLIEELKSGAIQTLILGGANPAYHLPATLKVGEALKKVPYVLSLNDRIDESLSAVANGAILPTSHFLESWGDVELLPGVIGLRQPVIRPLWETQSLEDRLIQLSGGNLAGVANFHEFLKSEWQKKAGGKAFRSFWTGSLQTGVYAPGLKALKGTRGGRNFNTGSLNIFPDTSSHAGFKLGMYYNVQVRDGSGANNAYRQELPDPVTKVVWENYAIIAPQTARDLKLKQGSVVNLKTKGGTIEVPVHLQPGTHPGAVLIALGYGRTAAGIVAEGRGKNTLSVAQIGSDSFVLSGIDVEIEATGDRQELANTQTVYRHGLNTEDRAFFAPGKVPNAPYNGSSDYNRPILIEGTLKDYQNNVNVVEQQRLTYPDHPKEGKKPEPSGIMQGWEYKDLRWHMVVDLNSCNGCGACVTSCNTENNIPMIGPENVARGREMHWLRIDRYYSGPEENPVVSHQPMLCQHCENAPCENVCPVAATTHSSEGLNVMTYNRCIGTRYCANNCPYKVRRFNWFDNWNWFDGLGKTLGERPQLRDPMQLALNPDVTVRSRGVMEKCTFCIQRINHARQEMKARNDRRVRDGALVTACQEVCATKAISFGDINDKDSEVARLSADKGRAYKVLDFLGVNPSVTYLAKIRNKD